MHQAGGVTGVVAVRPDLPLKSFADLRGKRVAVLKGTNPYMTLVLSLESAGVKENQVTIVNLQHTDAHTAFLSGHLDAIYGQVILYALRDQGKAKVLASPIFLRSMPSTPAPIWVTDKFARQYPQTTERVVKVLIQAAYWASNLKTRGLYQLCRHHRHADQIYPRKLQKRSQAAIQSRHLSGRDRRVQAHCQLRVRPQLIRRPDVAQ